LKTVDIDGSFAYSNTASLNYKNSEAVVNIYPNPAKSVIHVEVESLLEGKTQVEIVNAFGIVLVNESMNSTHVQLAVSSLSNGVYFVRVVKDGAVVAIKKVVKEWWRAGIRHEIKYSGSQFWETYFDWFSIFLTFNVFEWHIIRTFILY